MKFALGILFVFYCALPSIHGANILVYLGMGSYSHRVSLDPYMNGLVEKNHNVTFLSGFPSKRPNPKITEIIPPKLLEWTEILVNGEGLDVFKFRENSQVLKLWVNLPLLGLQACKTLYSDPVFLNWILDPKTKVDVVVFDTLANHCAYGIADFFKAKVIAFNTAHIYPWDVESSYGIPDESATYPDGMLHAPTDMNFFHRAATALLPLAYRVYKHGYVFPLLEEVTKQGLGLTELASFSEVQANTSLYFINTYWSIDFPRSYPPNVIPIGGISLPEKSATKKPLPKHLEDFVNKGNDGFIYVNFGTVAELTRFKPEIRQAFIKTLGNFPNIQFIWKSTHQIEEKLPSNVLVDKWLPQVDILNHPKIKLFVTHGGLGGIYESVSSKVPIICFPMFAEQEYNANIMVKQGYGIKLEILTVTEKELSDAISKVLNDSSYKKQVERIAKLLKDQPMSPKDTAVWWTEFILRNENTNEFLLPPSTRQSWWVRRQLDVWLAVFIVTLILSSAILATVYFIMKFMFNILFGSSNSTQGKLNLKKKVN